MPKPSIAIQLTKLRTSTNISTQASERRFCCTVMQVKRQHYRAEGMAVALEEKPRSGQPRRLSSEQEAALTLLACSEAPTGRDHWSVRL